MLRAALVILVLGFVGLLLVLGSLSFVRWVRSSYPRQARLILAACALLLAGVVVVGVLEMTGRPAFRPGDLIILNQPIAVRLAATERNVPSTTCIVEIREHLAVVDSGGGTLTARVESNRTSGAGLCPVGAEVTFDSAWLMRYTLTRR